MLKVEHTLKSVLWCLFAYLAGSAALLELPTDGLAGANSTAAIEDWSHLSSKFLRSKRSVVNAASLMPGTNWCGRGWRAEDFQDLGTYGPTDQCCRQHDLGCPVGIRPGETLAGLYNNWMYAVMHCPCDERFRMCLKMTHSPVSDTVGRLFFNVFKTPCFIVAKEKTCVERTWWFGECKKFQDTFVAQWKDPLPY